MAFNQGWEAYMDRPIMKKWEFTEKREFLQRMGEFFAEISGSFVHGWIAGVPIDRLYWQRRKAFERILKFMWEHLPKHLDPAAAEELKKRRTAAQLAALLPGAQLPRAGAGIMNDEAVWAGFGIDVPLPRAVFTMPTVAMPGVAAGITQAPQPTTPVPIPMAALAPSQPQQATPRPVTAAATGGTSAATPGTTTAAGVPAEGPLAGLDPAIAGPLAAALAPMLKGLQMLANHADRQDERFYEHVQATQDLRAAMESVQAMGGGPTLPPGGGFSSAQTAAAASTSHQEAKSKRSSRAGSRAGSAAPKRGRSHPS
jgi:hypothetical protein